MADALASAGAGHNLSRASFLDFTVKFNEVERELEDAQETVRSIRKRRKDLRKNMTAAGVDIDMFDRVLADLELTGDELRVRDFEYRRYMEWREKPVGFQPSMDLPDDPGERAFNVHELHAIDGEGFDAGETGRRRDSNPYRPGTEPHQRWDNAWGRGQAAAVAKMGTAPAPAANGHDTGAEPKRRGRPRGSGKNQKAAGGNGGEPQPEPPPEPGPTERPEQQPPPPEPPNPEPEPPAAAD